MILIRKKHCVTVNVNYWMPDYRSVLQEFIWQTNDYVPKLPRVHKFLDYWHKNIDAVISEIKVADTVDNSYLPVKEIYTLR